MANLFGMINMLSPKRKGRITGSVVGAILGVNKYKSADDVMRDMVRAYHGAPREFEGNVATEYGSFNEDGAIFDFVMECGFDVIQNERFFIHPEYDWLGATPDGIVGDDAVIEVKCPFGKRDATSADNFLGISGLPHYYAQMQIEMACTGRSKCYFYQWATKANQIEIVRFDKNWFDDALPKLKAFHDKYLKEIDNEDHLKPKRKIVDDKEAIKLADEYESVKNLIDELTKRSKEIINRLVEISGEKDAEINGHKLTRVEREGAVSYAKAIKKYAPDADLEQFRGAPTSYWRLS
tara:strand:+ start:671 stop:1552 length:882 start_codon:yes stop_codon:yes gene_type:complete